MIYKMHYRVHNNKIFSDNIKSIKCKKEYVWLEKIYCLGMSCASCSAHVEHDVSKLVGVKK